MNALAAKPDPMRVVIIDDTADLRELLKIALTRGGFQVVGEAGDGQQGIDMVRLHHPDVVLLDLAMPVMDGIEASLRLRQTGINRDTPIIALTANAMGAHRESW